MEELYGGYNNNRNRGKTQKDGDFQEEDVWAYMKETDFSCSSSSRRVKKSSNSTIESIAVPLQKSSTPVKINDKKSKRVSKDGSLVSSDGAVYYGNNAESTTEVDEEDDYGDGMVPPHEYIARRLARNQVASFSMMEGVGRTLKGRDLSKMRNAILTKTGFLE